MDANGGTDGQGEAGMFSSFWLKRGGNVQHRRCEGWDLIFASIADPFAVQSSGWRSEFVTANGSRMNANGRPDGRGEAGLFSSFRRKRGGNAQHRRCEGWWCLIGGAGCSVRFAEFADSSRLAPGSLRRAGVFSSFGRMQCPWPLISLPHLGPMGRIGPMDRFGCAVLFSSFCLNWAFGPSTINHQPTTGRPAFAEGSLKGSGGRCC